MVCSNCGYALGPDDQYCGGCGAFLTDAPDDEHEAWADEAAPATAAPSDPGRDAPSDDTPWGIPYAPTQAPAPEPARSGPSTAMIAAGVGIVALLALLLFWVLRPDGEESLASGSSTSDSTAGVTTPATTAGTDPGASPTATPTETSTASPTAEPAVVELPGSAEQCDNVGAFVVYRGNAETSCPFAENVGRAFAEVPQPVTAETALTGVSSPVTGLDYDLTCEFTTPVRCTGGDNAVVYLVPAS